ncbi:MAG: hypothetical protein JW986_01875 [Methanotrichaceae archaeon]|nr:hypothetical protein [Methanotrichaceae archaeon]
MSKAVLLLLCAYFATIAAAEECDLCKSYFTSGDYGRAIDCVDECTEVNMPDPEDLMLKGRICLCQYCQDSGESEAFHDRAIEAFDEYEGRMGRIGQDNPENQLDLAEVWAYRCRVDYEIAYDKELKSYYIRTVESCTRSTDRFAELSERSDLEDDAWYYREWAHKNLGDANDVDNCEKELKRLGGFKESIKCPRLTGELCGVLTGCPG